MISSVGGKLGGNFKLPPNFSAFYTTPWGAPDLVVEILSKSTAVDDKGDKKDVYERFGVREYWLVDSVKKSFEIYSLINDRFKLTSYLEDDGILKSNLLEGFEMDIEQLFEEAKFQ